MSATIEERELVERLIMQAHMALNLIDFMVDDPGYGEREGLKEGEFRIGDFIVRDTRTHEPAHSQP